MTGFQNAKHHYMYKNLRATLKFGVNKVSKTEMNHTGTLTGGTWL